MLLLLAILGVVLSQNCQRYKCYYPSTNVGFHYVEYSGANKAVEGVFACSGNESYKNGHQVCLSGRSVTFKPVYLNYNDKNELTELANDIEPTEYKFADKELATPDFTADLNFGYISSIIEDDKATIVNKISPYLRSVKTHQCAQYAQERIFNATPFTAKFCLDEKETQCYTVGEVFNSKGVHVYNTNDRYIKGMSWADDKTCILSNTKHTEYNRSTYQNGSTLQYLTFNPFSVFEYKKVTIYQPDGVECFKGSYEEFDAFDYEEAVRLTASNKKVIMDFGYFGDHRIKIQYVDSAKHVIDITHKFTFNKTTYDAEFYSYFGKQSISNIPDTAEKVIVSIWTYDEKKAVSREFFFENDVVEVTKEDFPIVEAYIQIPQNIPFAKDFVNEQIDLAGKFMITNDCTVGKSEACRPSQFIDENYIILNQRVVGVSQPVLFVTITDHPFFQKTPLAIVKRSGTAAGYSTATNAAFYLGLLASDEEFVIDITTQKGMTVSTNPITCKSRACDLQEQLNKALMIVKYAVPAATEKENLHVPAHYLFIHLGGSVQHSLERSGSILMLIDPTFENGKSQLNGASEDGKVFYHTYDISAWNAHTGVSILMPKMNFSARVVPFFNDTENDGTYSPFLIKDFTKVPSHYISKSLSTDRYYLNDSNCSVGSWDYYDKTFEISGNEFESESVNIDITQALIHVIRIKLDVDELKATYGEEQYRNVFPYTMDFSSGDSRSVIATVYWSIRSFLYYGAFSKKDLVHKATEKDAEHIYMLPGIYVDRNFWCVSNLPYNDASNGYIHGFIALDNKGNGLNIFDGKVNQIKDPKHHIYCTKGNKEAIGEEYDSGKDYAGHAVCDIETVSSIKLVPTPITSRDASIVLSDTIIKNSESSEEIVCDKRSKCTSFFETKDDFKYEEKTAEVLNVVLPIAIKNQTSSCNKYIYRIGNSFHYFDGVNKTQNVTLDISLDNEDICRTYTFKEIADYTDICFISYNINTLEGKDANSLYENFVNINTENELSIVNYDNMTLAAIDGSDSNFGVSSSPKGIIQCIPSDYNIIETAKIDARVYNLIFAGLLNTYGRKHITYFKKSTDYNQYKVSETFDSISNTPDNLAISISLMPVEKSTNLVNCYMGSDLTSYLFNTFAVVIGKPSTEKDFDAERYLNGYVEANVDSFYSRGVLNQSSNDGSTIVSPERIKFDFLFEVEADNLRPVIIPYYQDKEADFTCDIIDENDYIDGIYNAYGADLSKAARVNQTKSVTYGNKLYHFIADPNCYECKIVVKCINNNGSITDLTFKQNVIRIVSTEGFVNHLTNKLSQDLVYQNQDSSDVVSVSTFDGDSTKYYLSMYDEKTNKYDINKYPMNFLISRVSKDYALTKLTYMEYHPYLGSEEECTGKIEVVVEKKTFKNGNYLEVTDVLINDNSIKGNFSFLPIGCKHKFISKYAIGIQTIGSAVIINFNDEIVIHKDKNAIFSDFIDFKQYTDINDADESLITIEEDKIDEARTIINNCLSYYIPEIDTVACVASGIINSNIDSIAEKKTGFYKYNQIRRELGLCSMWEAFDSFNKIKYIEESGYLYAAMEVESSKSGYGQQYGYFLPQGWEIASPDEHAFNVLKYRDLGVDYVNTPSACFVLAGGHAYNRNGELCSEEQQLAIDGKIGEAWFADKSVLYDDRCLSVKDGAKSYILIRAYKVLSSQDLINGHSEWLHIDNTNKTKEFAENEDLVLTSSINDEIDEALRHGTSLKEEDIQFLSQERRSLKNDDLNYNRLARYAEVEGVNTNNLWTGVRAPTKIYEEAFPADGQSLLVYACAKLPVGTEKLFTEDNLYKRTVKNVDGTYTWDNDIEKDWRKRLSVYIDATYDNYNIFGLNRPFDPTITGKWQCVDVRVPLTHYKYRDAVLSEMNINFFYNNLIATTEKVNFAIAGYRVETGSLRTLSQNNITAVSSIDDKYYAELYIVNKSYEAVLAADGKIEFNESEKGISQSLQYPIEFRNPESPDTMPGYSGYGISVAISGEIKNPASFFKNTELTQLYVSQRKNDLHVFADLEDVNGNWSYHWYSPMDFTCVTTYGEQVEVDFSKAIDYLRKGTLDPESPIYNYFKKFPKVNATLDSAGYNFAPEVNRNMKAEGGILDTMIADGVLSDKLHYSWRIHRVGTNTKGSVFDIYFSDARLDISNDYEPTVGSEITNVNMFNTAEGSYNVGKSVVSLKYVENKKIYYFNGFTEITSKNPIDCAIVKFEKTLVVPGNVDGKDLASLKTYLLIDNSSYAHGAFDAVINSWTIKEFVPADDNYNEPISKPGFAEADPHMFTYHGYAYDFHKPGVYNYLTGDSEARNLQIQINIQSVNPVVSVDPTANIDESLRYDNGYLTPIIVDAESKKESDVVSIVSDFAAKVDGLGTIKLFSSKNAIYLKGNEVKKNTEVYSADGKASYSVKFIEIPEKSDIDVALNQITIVTPVIKVVAALYLVAGTKDKRYINVKSYASSNSHIISGMYGSNENTSYEAEKMYIFNSIADNSFDVNNRHNRLVGLFATDEIPSTTTSVYNKKSSIMTNDQAAAYCVLLYKADSLSYRNCMTDAKAFGIKTADNELTTVNKGVDGSLFDEIINSYIYNNPPKNNLPLIIGICVAVVAVILIISIPVGIKCSKTRKQKVMENCNVDSNANIDGNKIEAGVDDHAKEMYV